MRISLYPFITLETLILTTAFMLYYWTALYSLKERRCFETVIVGILILGVIESVYGLIQLAAGMNRILWWENIYNKNFVTGTFINRNHLAAFLSMSICLGVGYLWSLANRGNTEIRGQGRRTHLRENIMRAAGILGYRSVLALLALSLMTAALLGSASRGGVLSLFCGLVFMTGLIMARYFRSRRGFLLMVLFALMITYVGYVAADRVVERFRTFDAGLEDRIAISKDGLRMANDFPLTGSGPGTFEYVFPRYQSVHTNMIVDHAHNDWVELKSEYGWIGLAAVTAALSFFLILAIGRWRNRHDGFVVGVGIGGIGAVVAISVHSLSDFNLHIPANPLLLSLILAVTWRTLYSGKKMEPGYEGLSVSIRLTRNRMFAVTAVFFLLLAISAFFVIKNWRADALARTFQNSTLAYLDPSPEMLRQARGLAPGNAAYWLWTAGRLRVQPGEKDALLFPSEKLLPDPEMSLLSEGLRRNPCSWQIFREMAWTGFFSESASRNSRAAGLRQALGHIKAAVSLHPSDNRLKMESGIIALASYREESLPASSEDWEKPFREIMLEQPEAAVNIADLILLYLGDKGAEMMTAIIPPDTESHFNAARSLLKQGYIDTAMDLIRLGETERISQIERLWIEITQNGAWLDLKKTRLARKAAQLDPGHPGVLLAQGETISALQSIERRGDTFTKWGDVRVLISRIEAEMESKKGDSVHQSYYLGLLSKELGDHARAVWWTNRVLNLKSQHFPAWLLLRGLLKERIGTAADSIRLDTLEKKIRFYSMDGIVFDAWNWAGMKAGNPTWTAPFRISEKVEKARIRFSGPRGTVWSLNLDGRFTDIWKGPEREGTFAATIPPGEHEFSLTTWDPSFPVDGRGLPFRLEISWE
jgi:O-antigen ligase